jgi:ABC-type uncharacterized transport system involved in gliding motility auxiliary subunit
MKPWASLLGWLGALALLFALLSFLLQLFSGPVLLLSELAWSLGNLVVGVVLLGVALATNFDALRERLHSGEARRAGKYGTSAVLFTAFGIVLLAMLAFFSTRYHTRWDWTEAKSHSLAPQTHQLLDGLERDVRVTALYAAVAAHPARELLDRYSFVSDRLEVEYVDPQAQPGRLADLGIAPERLEGGLLHVALGEESVEVRELTEEALTHALVKLTRREEKKVYFLIGHQERPVEGEGAEEGAGYGEAARALANENYRVETLLLAAAGDVPEDADVVVAAGPTRPFHETELRALERHLARGGALLVMLDPRARTNLYEPLERWGVRLPEDVIVDRVQGLFGRPATPFAEEYGDHPITRPLRDAVLFHVARSVEPVAGAPGSFTVLVHTGPQSWAETDLDLFFSEGRAELGPEDRRGPVPVAVAGEIASEGDGAREAAHGEDDPDEDAGAARLVVFGDSDFASNQLIGEFGNRDLFVNTVNWLLGDVEAIAIRPGQARASRLQLTSEQFLQIRYLSLLVLPQAIAMLGVIAWWWRRRAPGR